MPWGRGSTACCPSLPRVGSGPRHDIAAAVSMAESMTEDGGLNRLIAAPNLNLSLNTRTRHLTAETRDLKMPTPAIPPVSGFPLLFRIPRRQTLNWVGARFIVPSSTEGAAKPRPYPRPPCGGPRSARSADPTSRQLASWSPHRTRYSILNTPYSHSGTKKGGRSRPSLLSQRTVQAFFV